MSDLSNAGKTTPIEDKYAGQRTADLLADDTLFPESEKKEPKTEEKVDDERVETPKEDDLLAEPEEKPKKEAKSEDEEEITIEDEPEIDLEQVEPTFPVAKAAILAKYPNIFKDFPHLERANYRDKQFTEVFATPSEARDAKEKVELFENVQKAIFTGETADILKDVRNVDSEAFNRLVDNYLPALQKADPSAHLHVMSNIGRQIVAGMYNESARIQNDDLKNAAILLHQYLFGNSEWTPPRNLSREQQTQNDTINEERQQLLQQRYSYAYNDLQSKISNKLKSTIDYHIDPNGKLSPYEKKKAIGDVMDAVDEQIAKDAYFAPYKDKLWAKAFETGFNPEAMTAVERAYLSRAKVLLRDVITRVRNEALKGTKRASEENKDKRGPIRPGGTSKPGTPAREGTKEAARAIPKGMTSLEYLNKE